MGDQSTAKAEGHTISTKQAQAVMKRCQIGTSSYDSANTLHAECYGTIGNLVAERDLLIDLLNSGRGGADLASSAIPADLLDVVANGG